MYAIAVPLETTESLLLDDVGELRLEADELILRQNETLGEAVELSFRDSPTVLVGGAGPVRRPERCCRPDLRLGLLVHTVP